LRGGFFVRWVENAPVEGYGSAVRPPPGRRWDFDESV